LQSSVFVAHHYDLKPVSRPLSSEHSAPNQVVDMRAVYAVLMAVSLGALDTAIANTALPSIGADLNSPPAASIWIINAYQLSIVASLLPLASLGDLIGPRKVFLGGVGVFTVFSLACALSNSLPMLALFRCAQGLGAAGIMSVNLALIKLLFPKERLGRGVGLNALIVGVSFALGPTVASVLLLLGPWQLLFAINVPLGIVSFCFALPALPRAGAQDHDFDPWTAALTALTFGCFIYVLSAATQRVGLLSLIPFILVFAVSLLALLKRQHGHPAPMLPVDLLKRPMFSLSALTSITSFAAQGAAFVALPFYFEHTLHRDAVETGFLITAWPLLAALSAPLAGRLSDKYPPAVLGGVGLSVLAVGFISLVTLPAQPSACDIVIRMAICGLGFGGFQSPNLKAILSSAPAHRSAGASGVIAMGRLIGQTTGAALVALCLGLAGEDKSGPIWALALGGVFSAVAACASFSRLWFKLPEDF
jgi:DHA2 family multidrug resistance protein-like MFS transporter